MGGASGRAGRAGIVVEISQSSKDVGGKMMGSTFLNYMYNMVGSQESCHHHVQPNIYLWLWYKSPCSSSIYDNNIVIFDIKIFISMYMIW